MHIDVLQISLSHRARYSHIYSSLLASTLRHFARKLKVTLHRYTHLLSKKFKINEKPSQKMIHAFRLDVRFSSTLY